MIDVLRTANFLLEMEAADSALSVWSNPVSGGGFPVSALAYRMGSPPQTETPTLGRAGTVSLQWQTLRASCVVTLLIVPADGNFSSHKLPTVVVTPIVSCDTVRLICIPREWDISRCLSF